jgi:hypothetical protein
MSGIIGHTQFITACEDMITAIETEMRDPACDNAAFFRLAYALAIVRKGLRYGRAASRLIACDIGTETYDEEVTP